MNGRAQFYMNLGLTLLLGDYGIIGDLCSEFTKPGYEQNGKWIAFDFFALAILGTITISLLRQSYLLTEKDHALRDL